MLQIPLVLLPVSDTLFSCWFSVPSQPIFPCIRFFPVWFPSGIQYILFHSPSTSRFIFSPNSTRAEEHFFAPPLTCIFALAFNGNVFLFFYCRFIFLRNKQFQNTMFKLSFDIRFRNILSYIEGTLAGSGITLPADIFPDFFSCSSLSSLSPH